jgi:hypothetical protein
MHRNWDDRDIDDELAAFDAQDADFGGAWCRVAVLARSRC